MKIEFENGYASGFKMAVGECFKDSMTKMRFNTGDIIYDDRRAYLSPWSEAIKHVSYAVQVTKMEGESVEFVVLRRKKDGSSLAKEKTVKQPIPDFVELLKTGL